MNIRSSVVGPVAMMLALPFFIVRAGSAATNETYEVSFSLPSGAALTSFQVEVDFSGVPGRFTGERGAVQCKGNDSLDALYAFYQCDPKQAAGCVADHQLNAALASVKPIVGPATLFTCSFESGGQVPLGADFKVQVVDSAIVRDGATSPSASFAVTTQVRAVR